MLPKLLNTLPISYSIFFLLKTPFDEHLLFNSSKLAFASTKIVIVLLSFVLAIPKASYSGPLPGYSL